MDSKRIRYQRPGDSVYVMVLWRHRTQWACFARCARPSTAMRPWREALQLQLTHAEAVEMVCAQNAAEARRQAALQYEPKRRARENPTCQNCSKPVSKLGDFCSDACREDWDAVVKRLDGLNAMVGNALLR